MNNQVEILSLPLGIDHCYLLKSGSSIVMVDGGAFGTNTDKFIAAIAKYQLKPKDFRLLILTHGHLDHICGAADIQQLGIPIALHQKDLPFLEQGQALYYQPPGITLMGKFMSVGGKALLPYLVKLKKTKVDLVLNDSGMDLHSYGIPGMVVFTPGHSYGSCSILTDSGEAFVGDCANNAWWLRIGPGLPALGEDLAMIVSSWKRMISLGAQTVYPAHGNPFPITVMQKEVARFKNV